ncbi:MAG: hypothetical protein NT108_03365 [Candidatus Kaiserbacteria bacterium]|nr:hypothetical protein [Candidatus Kaiserbacteria bacterium]
MGQTQKEILPGQQKILAKLFDKKEEEIEYVETHPRTQEEHADNCKTYSLAAVFLPPDIKTVLPWLETIDGIRYLFISATDISEVFIFGRDDAPVLREIKMDYAIERLVPTEV